jgi:uncharacterized membrane protein
VRSWRELAIAIALVACGTDSVPRGDDDPIPVDPEQCETSFLRYDNFGEPFTLDWCRGCHSTAVPATMRQNAPIEVNFDTLDQIRTWSERIAVRAASMTPTMPPAGGPTLDERTLLAEWIACGSQ